MRCIAALGAEGQLPWRERQLDVLPKGMHPVNPFCPVCGYELDTPPVNHSICPCCGTEFGYQDRGRSYEELRSSWIERGAHWWSPVDPLPTNWNSSTQLLRAGFNLEPRLMAMLAAMSQVGSFALSQALEGKVAFHISPPATGGVSSSPLVCRKGRRPIRKPARRARRSISDNNFNSQSGICTSMMGGARPAA